MAGFEVITEVEVDGDAFHMESPAEAHKRTTIIQDEGAKIERVKASDCSTEEKAKEVAEYLRSKFERYKATR